MQQRARSIGWVGVVGVATGLALVGCGTMGGGWGERTWDIRVESGRDARAFLLLERRCLPCHEKAPLPGMVDLTTRRRAVATGAVAPDPLAVSRLAAVVGAAEGGTVTMPPTGHALSAVEAEILTQWLEAGAPWPDDSRGRLSAVEGAEPRSR